jgi:cytochrome oxidase assembly protein ShyY1
MTISLLVEGVILVLGLGLITWQIKRLSAKVDMIIQSEHKCRESLPYKFAMKDSLGELWARTDKIEAGLKYLEGKLNGK